MRVAVRALLVVAAMAGAAVEVWAIRSGWSPASAALDLLAGWSLLAAAGWTAQVTGGCRALLGIVARLVSRTGLAEPLSVLTPREREVLGLMAEGRTNTAIGQRLFLSERTVEGNVRRIFDKLGLTDTPADNRRVLAVLAFLRA
jgi:DNA-binding CsgD family transcriptional regulator